MAEYTTNNYNTLPEQVQINKEDIETNTSDITKLKEDIGKIKPNAWEERKFKINEIDCITYNPITDTNTPVNIQKAFTDKDTYSITDAINSCSFAVSMNIEGTNAILYVICADPTLPLGDIFDNTQSTKDEIVFLSRESGGTLHITCSELKATGGVTTKSLSIGTLDNGDSIHEITKISDDDADTASSTLLSAFAISQYYLKKTEASNTYLTKTDASNTYATKLEYEANQADIVKLTKRVDSLDSASVDVPLTASGLAKIQANPTIGTPIKLITNTDFAIELADYHDDTKSIDFSLYKDDDEEVYIAYNIKLNVQKTTDYYADNDQPYIWWTGLGVIKLGASGTADNQYLCQIAYSHTYDNGLIIIPISKLA